LVLVLDDFHVIDNPSIHSALSFLLDHMPENLHIVLSGRSDPPLPLARFRARNRLVEIRVQDLRFTSGEAAAFLNQMMASNPPQMWPLGAHEAGYGLKLAAISLSRAHRYTSLFSFTAAIFLQRIPDRRS
jgi:LuxR family maltose regulon positive regulatory protein